MLNEKFKTLPVLSRVPAIGMGDLELKLSLTGVTFLRTNMTNPAKVTAATLVVRDPVTGYLKTIQTAETLLILDRETGSYKKRYTGGQAVVDCNGKLYLEKKDYLKTLQDEQLQKQLYLESLGYRTKKAPPKSATKTKGKHGNVVDAKDNAIPEIPKKQHRINKTEINNRLLVMTDALFAQVKNNSFLGMLTVSFPPAVSDSAASQALNTWFTALREKERRVLKNYIWVAERQKIGTIHYHILITNRMNVQYANRAMKTILCNMVRDGIVNYPLSAMKRYNGVDLAKKRYPGPGGTWINGPVTNFCDPKSRKALTNYITKYVTKNNAEFNHAAWGCSRAFSALFTGITCTYQEFQRMQLSDFCFMDPVIKTLWFEFFPWLRETGPPDWFRNHLTHVNGYILLAKNFLN